MAGLNAGQSLEQPALRGAVWIATILLFAITNLPWHLDNYDQAKQAFTSFEMVNQGHWLNQHTPNEKIATKPPLVGWVSAATYEITRSWECAWRLPSMAAALCLAAALWRAAKIYGAPAQVLAVSAFGLNLLAPRLATLVRTDMPLALIIFLLGLKIWEKIRKGQVWNAKDRLVMFALLTAAMLIKGPIVYAFLLPGIVAFQWCYRREKVSVWCGWWPWLASLAVFALWVAGGIATVPGFYEQVVVKEFAGRFGETMHRPQPFYFYLPHLLQKFAPWSLVSLGAGAAAWRARQKISAETSWLIAWSLGGLLVMSLIPSKRVDRIFPVIPPLCLFIAAQARTIRRWADLALVCAIIFTSVYVGEKIFSAYRHDDGALARFGAEVRRTNLRYEVIGGREEGLLLYLRKPRFIKADDAIARWNRSELDALVVPEEESPRLLQEMNNAVRSGLGASITTNGEKRSYILLRRASATK